MSESKNQPRLRMMKMKWVTLQAHCPKSSPARKVLAEEQSIPEKYKRLPVSFTETETRIIQQAQFSVEDDPNRISLSSSRTDTLEQKLSMRRLIAPEAPKAIRIDDKQEIQASDSLISINENQTEFDGTLPNGKEVESVELIDDPVTVKEIRDQIKIRCKEKARASEGHQPKEFSGSIVRKGKHNVLSIKLSGGQMKLAMALTSVASMSSEAEAKNRAATALSDGNKLSKTLDKKMEGSCSALHFKTFAEEEKLQVPTFIEKVSFNEQAFKKEGEITENGQNPVFA